MHMWWVNTSLAVFTDNTSPAIVIEDTPPALRFTPISNVVARTQVRPYVLNSRKQLELDCTASND